MRMCDENITLYIPFLDEQGDDAYARAELHGVSWFQTNSSQITEKGLKSSDQVYIRIPANAEGAYSYLPQNEFAEAKSKTYKWTLFEGVYVVRGTVEDDARPSELQKRYGRERVKVVTSYVDNRRRRMPHFKVVCS